MVLLFMQDITADQKRAAMERSFFHDISNIVFALVGASEELEDENAVTNRLKTLTSRLSDEVAIQKALAAADIDQYRPVLKWVSVSQVIGDLREVFASHPAAADKMLILRAPATNTRIRTDFSLLIRVLCNMVVNALEGTEDGGVVKLWVEDGHSSVSFCAWNRVYIPEDTARRVFQRNFSTKEGEGRGVGTWTMKLLCENYLDARIDFTSSRTEGTVFRATIPGGMLD
jgi:signal transduction histidine kinase